VSDDGHLAAGAFSAWLDGVQAAVRGEAASDVPCGTCTACCTSSQFVHIGPDETDTLARIPADLVFPAPRLPHGHVLLGYDERGHCPMLVNGRCSIYAHRPRTCRTYDCRVFPAGGIDADDDKPQIARQARRWRFDHPTEADRTEHAAVRAAAAYLAARPGELPPGAAPATATRRSVLAIQVHEAFLARDDAGRPRVVEPEPGAVRVEIARRDQPAAASSAGRTTSSEYGMDSGVGVLRPTTAT
jgi:Fe-S-cluster containining protein